MAKTEQFTPEQMAEALIKAQGFISATAEILGCSQQTVRNYIEKYDSVRQARDDSAEKTLDYVESKLMALVREKNATAIIFYLKTRGKSRGYVERQEVTGKDGDDIIYRVKFE